MRCTCLLYWPSCSCERDCAKDRHLSMRQLGSHPLAVNTILLSSAVQKSGARPHADLLR